MKIVSIEGKSVSPSSDNLVIEFEFEEKIYIINGVITKNMRTDSVGETQTEYFAKTGIIMHNKIEAYNTIATEKVAQFIAEKLIHNYAALKKLSS